jgi:tetratricopeptide (TPR) repeat protein
LANAIVSYALYLGKIVWPHPLAALYPYDRDLSSLKVAAALLLLAAITALVWWRRRESPYLPVGWFWFLGTLVPMIGLVQVGWQAYADRYTYIPSIGIFIALVWTIADANWKREPVIGVTLAILSAFAYLTWAQISYWSDDLTLFQHAIEVTSANPFAQYHVGDDLVEAGKIGEAVPHLEEAIRLRPNFAAAYFTLGKAQAVEGQNEAALGNFSQALRIAPDFAKAYYSRALTYLKDGQMQPAELDFRAALQHGLDAEFAPDADNTLGVILAQRGQITEAIAQFREAVRLRPDLVVAQRNLAMTLAGQGRTEEAIASLIQALSITHDSDLAKMLHDIRGQ